MYDNFSFLPVVDHVYEHINHIDSVNGVLLFSLFVTFLYTMFNHCNKFILPHKHNPKNIRNETQKSESDSELEVELEYESNSDNYEIINDNVDQDDSDSEFESSSSELNDNTQCLGLRKDSEQCNNQRRYGKVTCHLHRRQNKKLLEQVLK
jgi:hypothetical protein